MGLKQSVHSLMAEFCRAEQLHYGTVAILRRPQKWCIRDPILPMSIHAVRHQERRDNSSISVLGGHRAWGFFSRIGGLRVDLRPAQQLLSHRLVSQLCGDEQGRLFPLVRDVWIIVIFVREWELDDCIMTIVRRQQQRFLVIPVFKVGVYARCSQQNYTTTT